MARWLAAAGALWLLAGCDAVVRSELSETQANQIVVALDGAAIAGRKVAAAGGGHGRSYRVEVPAGELNAALRVLERQGLPTAEAPSTADLLRSSGLVATPEEERARLGAASAGELARSLERLDGVASARVHLVLPSPARPLDAPAAPPQAAVLLVRRSARAIDEQAVRRLVSAAVAGLDPAAVTIVQTRAATLPETAVSTVRVGPFSVRRESAPLLRSVLTAALLLHIALAAGLIWAVRRKRAAQQPDPQG